MHPMADERLLIERWGTADEIDDPFVNPNVLHYNPLRLRDGISRRARSSSRPDTAR
jgi:hypothetical protein